MHTTSSPLCRYAALQVVLLLLALGRSPAQVTVPDSAAHTATILAIEGALLDAVGAGDTSVWKKYLDDSFLAVSEDGSRSTKAELLSSIHPLPKGYAGRISILEPAITFSGDVAVLHYVADEHETVYGQQLHTTYATMNVYHRRDGRWLLLSSQIFEIPQIPPRAVVPATILGSYAGVYELAEGVTYTVESIGGALYGARSGQTRKELIPETENVFFLQDDARGRKIFLAGADGGMRMIARRNGNDVVWKRSK